jgi:hypothetical protein
MQLQHLTSRRQDGQDGSLVSLPAAATTRHMQPFFNAMYTGVVVSSSIRCHGMSKGLCLLWKRAATYFVDHETVSALHSCCQQANLQAA